MIVTLRFVALLVALAFAGTAAVFLIAAARGSGPTQLPHVPPGFTLTLIARVPHARELAATPNGDLIVGTNGRDVYVVPGADGAPGPARVFATLPDREAAGVALGDGFLYVGSNHGVWRVAFKTGDREAEAPFVKIASVRTLGGFGHSTTSVALSGKTLFASVGSSCNACEERDPTRATIQQMSPDGSDMRPKAVHIRNAIALAVNPDTGALWAGVAGQDELEQGHPYEILDDVSAQPGVADYGWPYCYEDRRPVQADRNCANVAVARAYFPAYATPIGAAIYPLHPKGAHAFPQAYRGGIFVALHGSWHQPPVPPEVAFVALRDDRPLVPIDWSDPAKQSSAFLDGFQAEDGRRFGRPTGVAVGADGSLFVADDDAGAIYRIRPKS